MKAPACLWLLFLLATACDRTPDPFYYASEAEFIANDAGLSDTAILGKRIFFDANLSEPAGVSCASCHSPMSGFADPRKVAFSPGADPGTFGDRNAISIAYNSFAPTKHAVEIGGAMEEVGGFFWDGRAEFLESQSISPLLSEKEMNNRTLRSVVGKLYAADYYPQFEKLYGKRPVNDSQMILLLMTLSVKAFLQSHQVNPFTSKYDRYLEQQAELTPQELRGLKLFSDDKKTKCATCHVLDKEETTGRILFTDFSYDNIGLPKHPQQANRPVDLGLAGAELFDSLEIGKFRSPSLRNVAMSAPYMHNGVFATLEDVLEFYNARDVDPKFVPEYPRTMNREDLGDLKLTKAEQADIIAFLKTLSDGYRPD